MKRIAFKGSAFALLPLALVSVLAAPASANWFSTDPATGTRKNIGSTPNPTPEELRNYRAEQQNRSAQKSAGANARVDSEMGIASERAGDTDTRMDIIDTALASGQFKTLARALAAADLVDMLKAHGSLTVFAPTDEAFAKLPSGMLDDLLQPENKERLRAILTYHVIPEKLTAADLASRADATTVNGDALSIDGSGSAVSVNGAKLTTLDIPASNGVIHAVDTVILPS